MERKTSEQLISLNETLKIFILFCIILMFLLQVNAYIKTSNAYINKLNRMEMLSLLPFNKPLQLPFTCIKSIQL